MLEQSKARGAVRAGCTYRKSLDFGRFARSRLVDEQSFRGQDPGQIGREAVVREVPVGRVAKDQVVRSAVGRERLEDVALHGARSGEAELLEVPLDRAHRFTIRLDEYRRGSAARERLEPHRPRAGKEIEDGRSIDGADQVE